MKTIKYILLSAVLIGFTACNDEEDFDMTEAEVVLPELTTGSLDLSNYVALGASFTSGFTDNALFITAQENSFPNQLATQFAKAGSGSFSQPLMSDNTGGLLFNGMPAPDGSFGPRLFFNGAGPAVLPGMSTTEATNNLGGTFNNVGVPGAKSFHVPFQGYGALNPYFGRMASSPTASMLGDAVAQSPTFFTLSEIGGNDVLTYATSGGVGVDQTGNINPLTYSNNDITDPNVFAQSFNAMVTALTQNGAKGVVTNVPDITSLAHFTTVPHNPIPLDAATAGFLNSASAYGAYNGGLDATLAFLLANPPQLAFFFPPANDMTSEEIAQAEIARRKITFSEGEGNAVVIFDENLTDLTAINAGLVNMRQATAEDLLVLPSSSFIGTEAIPGNPATVNGVAIPLADKWVLTPEEQLAIATATAAYNATIESVTSSNPNVALTDLRAVLEQAATVGYPYDEYTMTTDLVFGGMVSLDGVHLTARGYGLMAREWMLLLVQIL
jgi:lysophospholipase L1-like esterase